MSGSQRAILDTSVLLATKLPPIPGELAISAASLAELHFGVLVTRDEKVRADRLNRVGMIEAGFEALPIGVTVARAYGRLAAAVVAAGRQPRARVMDLLIAATAVAHDATLYTRNADDLRGLEGILPIVTV
ncbi:MAG TPA: type II toxin-antitoxin system VapC family toxin [Mycobacteriales bacterium]|nr:type II toxin-antitoxin system VapC family toxin [Mycobacteriales bacterium]